MSRQASGESGPGELRAADVAEVTAQLRSILAGLAGDDLPLRAPVGTPLLRDGIGLDSLGGTMLLAEVQRRFGVDVAGEDRGEEGREEGFWRGRESNDPSPRRGREGPEDESAPGACPFSRR